MGQVAKKARVNPYDYIWTGRKHLLSADTRQRLERKVQASEAMHKASERMRNLAFAANYAPEQTPEQQAAALAYLNAYHVAEQAESDFMQYAAQSQAA